MSLDKQQASVYSPYTLSNKRNLLPGAMDLYQKGLLEGCRKIEASEDIPFVASWNIATLPSDLTRCRLQFDSNAELNYEVILASFELINFLIELMENQQRDFSQAFYRRLLHVDR
jgi:hypothetical protein